MKKFILTMILSLSILTQQAYANEAADVTIDVNGLVCDFCAQALQKVFGKQESVEKINVNLDTKKIEVWFDEGGNLDNDTLTKLIVDSGYNVVGINR